MVFHLTIYYYQDDRRRLKDFKFNPFTKVTHKQYYIYEVTTVNVNNEQETYVNYYGIFWKDDHENEIFKKITINDIENLFPNNGGVSSDELAEQLDETLQFYNVSLYFIT